MGQAADWAAYPGGVAELMKFLRSRLGKPQLPELSELLTKYFKGSRRRPSETINEYITRKCELYVRAQQALRRLQQGQTTSTSSQASAPTSYSRAGWTWRWAPGSEDRGSRWNSAASQEEFEDPPQAAAPTTEGSTAEEGSEASTAGAGSGGWGWNSGWSGWSGQQWSWRQPYWQWSEWNGPMSTRGGDQLADIVPDFVQGWMLLHDSNLDVHERNMIQTALRGDFGLQNVATELRAQWNDTELMKRDKGHRHSSYLGELLEDEEDPIMDPDLALLADEGMNEEGLAIMDETHHSMQEAMATIERGRRTLREARAKQHEVRLSRKYYKTSTTSRPSSFGARDDSKLTCLRCGRVGHRAANCPDKDKPQDGPGASMAEEQAPFVCYAEAEAFAGQVSGAPNTQMAMQAGKAILDGGATKSIASVTALEALMDINYRKHGENRPVSLDGKNRPTFGFGNSSTDKCLSTATMRIKAAGKDGNLTIHTLDRGDGPILLSVATLRALGAVVDFEADLIVFRNLDPERVVALERSSTGHQLLPLSEDIFEGARKLAKPLKSLRDLVE